MTSHIDTVQTSLSEDLLFLRRLWFSPRLPRCPFNNDRELILNTVALYMTTGRPDGVIATFFHETTSTLYLAKSGPLSHEDADIATSFLSCLKDATGFETLLPFLARHSADNVEKRVRNLSQSFQQISHSLATVALQPVENTALESLESLLESPFRFNNTVETHNNFIDIIAASKNFLKLFSSFEDPLAYMFGRTYLSRLKRHLAKVVQYLDVKQLIRFFQRNNSKIELLWIPDTSQRQLSLNTETFVVRHLDDFLAWAITGFDSSEEAQIRECIASSLRRGEQPLKVTPLVDPEIRLIMYLTDVVEVQSQYLPDTQLHIGSSKRICSCCDKWIDTFNKCLVVKWTTAYFSNNMQSDWRIPDPDLTQHIQAAVCQSNGAVLEHVKREITVKLFKKVDVAIDELLRY
ncbi:hypothetical protein J132_02005 [Termitomyces sp. J132]|nr:hypothetical protein H2248_000222 [Termitomyces sp. 'cryptogamus']KNZ75753.1 hypothetical protein J132_02005 [Termitomyces sp. J132]